MTPEHLEAQVEMSLQEAEENEEEVVTDFSVRLIEKLAKDNKMKPDQGLDSAADIGPSMPVDPLSLSSLLSQGFEEGPARQALRKFNNNTQAALDYLVGGDDEVKDAVDDGVRMPTTVRRVQRMKERRKQEAARRRQQQEEEEERAEQKRIQAASKKAAEAAQSARSDSDKASQAKESKPQAAATQDLLGFDDAPSKANAAASSTAAMNLLDFGNDEPPPPTDFSKQVPTISLPEQVTLDLSKCEKPPLEAAVAAGLVQPRAGPSAGSGQLGSAPSTGPPDPANALAAAMGIAAQANITPEQLIAAAQQLHAQQGLAQPAMNLGGYAATAPAAAPAPAPVQAKPAATGLDSLDPFSQ
eukprot:TRINITY_DN10966_c0_g1_i1.p1 TRINITY_DN10966_c0_g1~~TRINITY_DN10966_c0_g1_i1.p1  ORF type:complete len:405 (+),score=145.55 TRINITY_DN10966_c0_g1_i1:146-1216(+)